MADGPKLIARDGAQLADVPLDPQTLVGALADAMAVVEAGHKMTKFHLIVEVESITDPGLTERLSWDSGLTCSEAVFVLEAAKFDIMLAMREVD